MLIGGQQVPEKILSQSSEMSRTSHNPPVRKIDIPPDLSQRLARIYDRAATRYRDHQATQHERITRELSGFTVQPGTIGGVQVQRVIVAARPEVKAA